MPVRGLAGCALGFRAAGFALRARGVEVAAAVSVKLDIKGGRHYTASQLLAGGFDLRNTAATTLRHYADPVP